MNLNDLRLFVQVVDSGGFAAAGRALRVSKSTLSHRIRALEESLDARLLNRTTRQLSLTDAGNAFYEEAAAVVQRAGVAEEAVRSRTLEPSGLVRYTTAVAEAQFALRPALSDFLLRHPKVCLFEHATDREIDLSREGFDVAVRAHQGPLRDSRLVQRVLGTVEWQVFGSPSYLAGAAAIAEPADLLEHPSLFTRRADGGAVWQMRRDGETQRHALPSEPRVVSDSMAGLKEMASAGLGVTALPAYICRAEVLSGQLVRVLPGWSAGESTLSALIPERRGLLPAVRVFVDHLAEAVPAAIRA